MVGNLIIEDVYKEFKQPDNETVHALNGISLDIHPGEFITLIGPSGCGKSTLLRLLAGLDFPTKGKLFLDGVQIKGPSCDRGLVFQEHALYPWLNIRDNISFGLRARGIYKETKDSVQSFIIKMGLSGFEKSYPHQLSGGMCQRAALARALIGSPKVLLLDEPLGALDAFTRMNMQDELLRIRGENKTTMVMVTHDVDEAVYLSDRIVVMSARPAKVEEIVNVRMYQPRNRNSADFIRIRSRILEILHFAGNVPENEYSI